MNGGGSEDWQPLLHATIKLDAAIVDLKWAHMSGMLSATTDNSCYVLVEHELQRKVGPCPAVGAVSNAVSTCLEETVYTCVEGCCVRMPEGVFSVSVVCFLCRLCDVRVV